MTEERNVEERNTEKCECKCQKILVKFLLNTISVFLGVLLALLVLRGLTAPKFMPCPMRGGCPIMGKQLPPPPMYGHRKFHKGFPQDFNQKGDFQIENQRPLPPKPQK